MGQSSKTRLEGIKILTLDNEGRHFDGSLDIVDGKIEALGPTLGPPGDGMSVVDRRGWVCLPGFVQSHVHLCQTLFKGLAEGLTLDQWLEKRIWPFEAVHNKKSITASARLGIAEAILAGVTTMLDMGTVHHTESIAEVVEEMGIRATIGKAMMDLGDNVPPSLLESPQQALAESRALYEHWHNKADGRIQVSLAPRFTLSVSADLWHELGAYATNKQILVHTHACETLWENETCQAIHGDRPIPLLERWGVLGAPTVLAHAIWVDDADRAIMHRFGASVAHCPGSNAKLGSGIIDLRQMLDSSIPVGLGSDGAACNDLLSIRSEMRLAAQLQSIKYGPGHIKADQALLMATRLGAQAINRACEIGSLEPGKAADLILFRCEDLDWTTDLPIHHSLTNGSPGLRPQEVYINGKLMVADGTLMHHSMENIIEDARIQRSELLERVQ